MIRFPCVCGQQLQAREENAGKVVVCPACQQRVPVPETPVDSLPAEESEKFTPAGERIQRERPAFRDENEEESFADVRTSSASAGSSGKAIASLILGIFSLFCNVLAGVPAVIMGILALRDIGRSGDRLTGRGLATAGIITAGVGTLMSCFLLLPALLIPAVQRVREAAARAQSQNNLKQLILAMHNYHDVYEGHLPAAAICDKNGKPLLSWRVALLPFIEQQGLYNQFKLDEPWDGPNNKRLLAMMPKTYRLPNDTETPPDRTHYQVFVGNGAAFDLRRGNSIPRDFPDGTSNTIFIAEVDKAVPWTKPEDVAFDPTRPMVPLMEHHFRNGFQVAMGDGVVRMVRPEISEATFKAAITRQGRDVLGPDW